MSVKFYSAVFLTFLMLTSSFLVVFPIKAQPAQGDWIVYGTETINNREIVLNGNLIVEAGSRLFLNNVTLIINSSYDGSMVLT